MSKTNKVVEVAGFKLPLTSYGSDQHQNLLCKDSKDFFPIQYTNRTQAVNKVLKLANAGIEAHVVSPMMFNRGFKINVLTGA